MEWYVIPLFIAGLLCLIKGGDWFVEGASGIAKRFRIPEILIGATVVSIGTTLPEVMVSATSAVEGFGGIAFGNAIGSIICNSALIAAITISVKAGKIDRRTMITPVLFFFASAIYYSLTAYISGKFTRISGIILLIIFVAYMVITVLMMKRKDDTPEEIAELELKRLQIEKCTCVDIDVKCEHCEKIDTGEPVLKKKVFDKMLIKEIVFIVIGAALIAIGARLLVDNATVMARFFGMSEAIIGLTIVALGTSLPELVTAITSLVKGHGSLSLGNVIGANLFNLILVSGVSITISPFAVPVEDVLPNGMLSSLVIDIPVMLGVMAILSIPALIRGKLSRVQGISLLAIYAGYIALRMLLIQT
ncbi:MAG: calcium/sodium antiporter [Clostridia bacterium]|nr:calcium/sodium antiporter [Clostridia bacterium]